MSLLPALAISPCREAMRIGAGQAEEIVLLMDGAEGFDNHLQKSLPTARQMVDYWHVCQHISECALQLYPADSARSDSWRIRPEESSGQFAKK